MPAEDIRHPETQPMSSKGDTEKYKIQKKGQKREGREHLIKKELGRSPWWSSVKNPPANVGNMGLITGLGRFHMPWSN